VKAEVVAQGCVVELKAAPGEAAVVIRELPGTSGTSCPSIHQASPGLASDRPALWAVVQALPVAAAGHPIASKTASGSR
jgi:hypothetical protein